MLILAFVFSMQAFAVTPPKSVKESFAKKFPNATNVKWEKENAREFEAEFSLDGSATSANFSAKGDWLETDSETSFEKLPAPVQAAFKAKHKGAKVTLVAQIKSATNETKFEIEFSTGKAKREAMYSADGKEVK